MFIIKIYFLAFLISQACSGITEKKPWPRDPTSGRPLPWWQLLDGFTTIGILPGFENPPLPSSGKACIPLDETVGDGPENALWYFREDLLINAQHIFWHASNMNGLGVPNATITQDRRAELFYYFHRNILARYDAERLSNGFDRVKAIIYEEGALVEMGYDPHFHENKTLYHYPPRPDNMPFINIIHNMNTLRLLESDIDIRTLIAINGSLVPINDGNGIDILADAIEASIKNVNEFRYSMFGIHNDGHSDIGYMSDDGGEVSVPVMLNPSTAMRDPVFYKWHQLIDDLFYRHQALLTPNHPVEGEYPLLWAGISVDSFSVQSENQNSSNTLRTYFKTDNISIPILEDINMSEEATDYCMKRLNYDNFSYNISISKQPFIRSNKATIRLFMSPRFNETGGRFTMRDQARQFFALDAFTVDMAAGQTTISRNASSSSLNINWKLETWMESPPSVENPECGCGWPSHLLLPKGTSQGMTFDLFVMVTDAEVDTPSSSLENSQVETPMQEPVCKMSSILCGVKGEKYPDVRPMGYPFNTLPFSVSTPIGGSRMVADLEEYVNYLPNSKAIQVVIKHDG